jgi:hypothetical protein
MSEASAGGISRAEMERRLVERSLQEESFRQRLLDDPKGTIEQELGTRVTEGFEVRVVEETQDTIYLVLPSTPMADREGIVLSDQQLESVSGAGTSGSPWGALTCGYACD